jgi:hypothetical protein
MARATRSFPTPACTHGAKTLVRIRIRDAHDYDPRWPRIWELPSGKRMGARVRNEGKGRKATRRPRLVEVLPHEGPQIAPPPFPRSRSDGRISHHAPRRIVYLQVS